MSALQGCVLAAGKGTRMGGDRPKVLFEANGKTLLAWVLGALSEAGVDDCVVVVGHRKEEVVAKLPTGVRWVEQSPQLGTGHAVRCARGAFRDGARNLLVTYGDMPLVAPSTYARLASVREESDADAVVLTVRIDPGSRFGRVVRGGDGAIRRIVEYKDAAGDELQIDEGNAGVYCFRPEALWPALERVGSGNAQGEYYLTDVFEILANRGGRLLAALSTVPGEGRGVNTPAELAEAAAALARAESER